MKYLLSILLISVIACTQHKLTAQEISTRLKKIRTELINAKALPPAFKNKILPAEEHDGSWFFIYRTTRIENNHTDSVQMNITIHNKKGTVDDDYINFAELHFNDSLTINGKEGISYTYEINNEGIIQWAYFTNPPTTEVKIDTLNDGSMLYKPSNQPIVEIASNPDMLADKNQDSIKVYAKYTARLESTLNELEKSLFNK